MRRGLMLLLPLMGALLMAQTPALAPADLVSALRTGGYVIVMRHASSPNTLPDASHVDADNVQHERQLDEVGRSSARGMGEALRQLGIPVGHVLSSPTYRALETVRLARLGKPETFPQLGDSGQSMRMDQGGTRAAWLRAQSSEVPPFGANIIVVTHLPNIREAFGPDSEGIADGESLVFHPDGRGGTQLVGRIKIEDWPKLAAVR